MIGNLIQIEKDLVMVPMNIIKKQNQHLGQLYGEQIKMELIVMMEEEHVQLDGKNFQKKQENSVEI